MIKLIVNDVITESTPELIAHLFCDLDSGQQAIFYNHIADISERFDFSFPMQLQYITEEDGLNLHGRRIMQSIGEYSHWGLSCNLIEETMR